MISGTVEREVCVTHPARPLPAFSSTLPSSTIYLWYCTVHSKGHTSHLTHVLSSATALPLTSAFLLLRPNLPTEWLVRDPAPGNAETYLDDYASSMCLTCSCHIVLYNSWLRCAWLERHYSVCHVQGKYFNSGRRVRQRKRNDQMRAMVGLRRPYHIL